MSTYRKIHGRSIQAVATDPTESVAEGQVWYNTTSDTFKTVLVSEAWASSAPMISAKKAAMPGGIQTAAFTAGGNDGSTNVNSTFEYNGSGFSSGGNINTTRRGGGGGGTLTAGIISGGFITAVTNATEEYDGTSWSSANNMNTSRSGQAAFGTQTANVISGGQPGQGTTTEEYDGTNWTTVNTNPTDGAERAGDGILTAGITFGGHTPAPAKISSSELYDGTNWTSAPSLNTARERLSGFGPQSSAYAFGGDTGSTVANTENYNGTSWSEIADMATARKENQSGQTGSSTAGVAMGGNTGPGADIDTTEEFTKSTNTITAAAWASGGALNTNRSLLAGAITSETSGIVFGGSAPYTGKTESYNGTSWSELGDMNSARSYLSGFGTATAAVAAGGYFSTPGTPNVPKSEVEEWNGSAWSEETNLPASRKSAGNCGTLTAGLIMGGSSAQPYTANIVSTTFEYDGSSWTAGGALPEGKGQAASGGTQTASFYAAGVLAPGGRSSKTAFYNGSSWSEGANVVTISPSSGGLGAIGTTSAGLATSGNNLTNIYDGTAWATAPNYSTARNRGTSGATASDALLVAGYSAPLSPSYTNATEEFTGETTAGNITDFTTS
jgi:hypothetical protein